MMIDKLRKRLNNSASLGKTLARTQQQHFSYFAEPREFDLKSLNQSKSISKKLSKKDPISTPKVSAKAVPSNLCIGDSLANIQLNRRKCNGLSLQVHTSTMAKSLRVNKMYKDLHHFSVCVEQLKWLLTQGDTLIRAYLAQTTLIAPQSSHTLDVANISQEFRSLVLRFAQIQKEQLAGIDEYIKIAMRENAEMGMGMGIGIGGVRCGMSEEMKGNDRPLPTFPDGHSMISSKDNGRDSSEGPSFLQTRHFSVPLKQNINSSNLPHFDNIKILKSSSISQSTKHKHQNHTNMKQSIQQHHQPMMTQSIKQNENDHDEKYQEFQKEKEELYKKLRHEHERNQNLHGSIQMLKQQIASLQRKLSTYQIASHKSIDKFSEVLKRLVCNLTQQQKEFQLLKMAQSISNWEKMIDDDQQQAKYRQLYGHPEAMQGEKTIKLKEIIELQYEINNLLGQKRQLQKNISLQMQKVNDLAGNSEEMYRMLLIQATTLEQLCNI